MADPAPIEYQRDLGSMLGASPGDLTPALQQQIGSAIDDLIDDWREELIEVWPRDTGHSFTLWESFRSGFVVTLRNPVEYAGYVHPEGGTDGESWDSMREFFEAAARSLVANFAPLVAADRRQPTGVVNADLAAAARNRPSAVSAFRALNVLAGRKPARNLSVFRGVRRALERVSSAERARARDRGRTRTRVR